MATTEATQNGSTTATQSDPQTVPSEPPTATTATEPEPESEPINQDLESESPSADKKWPGWPGDCVFRLIVPVLKVGSIIGRRGDLIKKMCEETRARIRVLDGALGTPDRIVSLFLSLLTTHAKQQIRVSFLTILNFSFRC